MTFRAVYTNVDPNLVVDQRNFRAKYLQNGEKKTTKNVDLSHFSSCNIMSHLICTDLISNLLDPGSTLVHMAHIDFYAGCVKSNKNSAASTFGLKLQ